VSYRVYFVCYLFVYFLTLAHLKSFQDSLRVLSLPPPPFSTYILSGLSIEDKSTKEVEIYTNTVRTISQTCDEHNTCRPVYIHRHSLPVSSNVFAGWAQQVPDIRIYTYENHALQLGPLPIYTCQNTVTRGRDVQGRYIYKLLTPRVFRQPLTVRIRDPILSDKISIARPPARYVVDGPNDQYDAHAV